MRVSSTRLTVRAARIVLLAIATMAFAAAGLAQSQSAAADLTGTVTDPTGAVIAGATVHARGIGTGINRTVTTDSEGNYQIISLPPGEYEVTAEAANFKKTVLS